MATGYGALAIYVPTLIAPQLLAEFGWSKSAFALISALGIAASMCMPFVGRLATCSEYAGPPSSACSVCPWPMAPIPS